MKNINITINITLLKLIGVLVILCGLYGFVRGIHTDSYVSDSLLLVASGAGMLGYRKYLTTKDSKLK